jgi:hypothetical protein
LLSLSKSEEQDSPPAIFLSSGGLEKCSASAIA